MLIKVRNVYLEFPRTFWVLMAGTFIDNLGGALLFPFFSLYITDHFGVGLTEVGWLFAIFAITSVFGSMLGGAMADKFGRKVMIVVGLVISALSSLSMGLVDDLNTFYILAGFVGLLGNTGGPAQQAMVADLLPEEKHAEGYGMQRVVLNMALTIGPAIGGFLAATNFMMLFIFDALSSIITAVIVFGYLPETKPETTEDQAEQSLGQTFAGYSKVLRDRVYMVFIFVSLLMIIVYVQITSTLPVFLRNLHGISPIRFGYILSVNAGMVVLFQFWITRRISARPAMVMMAIGTGFYLVGFSMYGFVAGFPLFLLAMIILTVGEMIVTPVAQAIVARLAPEDMRGRYMAMYGFSWTIPYAIGPLLAGYITDYIDPNWVWYASGIVSLMAIFGYLGLHLKSGERFQIAAEIGQDENSAPANN
ncbi:MAG: MFS transporter [Chloroflexi bacterium]|nr:MFS transporter [Chloroflexota bacterium]